MPTTVKAAHRPRKAHAAPARPKPTVVENHHQAQAAARSGASHLLVHKGLLSQYARLLAAHKRHGGHVTQAMLDALHKHASGKDTHAHMTGGSFKSFMGKVGSALKDAGKWTLNAGKTAVGAATSVVDTVAPLVAAAAPIIKAIAV